ncbi:YfjI family protein [Simplicispira piscis]
MIIYPLPNELLPRKFDTTVSEVAMALQAPIELVTSVALAAAAVAVGHNCTVQRKPGLDGPTSLFILVICDSGERKSAVQSLIFKEINDLQSVWQHDASEEAERIKVEHTIWTEKVKLARAALKRTARKHGALDEAENRLRDILIAEPKPTKARRIIYVDSTPEALLLGLHECGNSAGLVHDEFGQFIDGPMASKLPLLNSLWSGMNATVDRKTSDSFVLTNARLTCLFQAQPEVFKRFMLKQGQQARGNGFLSRTLLGFPLSTQGWRAETAEVACPKLEWFYERCKALLSRTEQRVLRFSPVAQVRWHDISASYELQMQPNGIFNDMKDFASKAAENIARVAAVLHAFETDDSDEISDEVLIAANNLVAWHGEQYRSVLTSTNLLEEKQRRIDELYNWIASTMMSRNWNHLLCSYLMQYGPNFARKKAVMHELLDSLAQSGRILIFYDGKRKFIQLPRPTFQCW